MSNLMSNLPDSTEFLKKTSDDEKNEITIYKVTKDATWKQIFDSLSKDRNKLCLLKINQGEDKE